MKNEINRSAVVIGGSNGVGLAITRELIGRGWFVHILGVSQPGEYLAGLEEGFDFHYFNVMDIDRELLKGFCADERVELLMVNAGVGRLADFSALTELEIHKTLAINTAAIEVIHAFYSRICGEKPFYCGVMGSIAGHVSSPKFSVYAASKAAVCRFVESVNIELEYSGTPNRILDVSPGSIKGTRFNGGGNDLSLTAPLARDIVDHLLAGDELFIPQYEEVYKGVLERYKADAHAFGLQSYEYKQRSGRESSTPKVTVGYLSGTFDLFHVGHLNLLERAKKHCDYLVVGVHPDASHKGKETFIPFEERMRIVGACRQVDRVVPACREDCDAWELWHYDRLFVGSDYKGTERFRRYEEYFADKGVEIVYFPYTQGTSSTQIRATIKKSAD